MLEEPQPRIDFEPTSSVWNHDQFRDTIVEAVRKRDIAFSALPDSIKLSGKIGDLSNRLLDATLNDPDHPEYGSYGKVSLDGKLLLATTFARGVRDHVTVTATYLKENPIINPQYAKSEYHALTLHTHGNLDLPPSPVDVLALLSPTEENGSQSSIVVTPENRYLLLRTIRTPDLSDIQKKDFLILHNDALINAMRAESIRYAEHFKMLGIRMNSETINRHMESIETQGDIQFRVLKKLCRENHIGLYKGRANNFYRRER